MADVFLSYAPSDAKIAEQVACLIEAAGMSSWYWTRDIDRATRHPEQTFVQLDQSRSVLCVVSREAVQTGFIFREVRRAHLQHKPLVVILNGMTYAELEHHGPRWCEALGGFPQLNGVPAATARLSQQSARHCVLHRPQLALKRTPMQSVMCWRQSWRYP